IGIDLRPAALLPAPCHDPRRHAVDRGRRKRPADFAPDLSVESGIKFWMAPTGEPGVDATGDAVADGDNRGHRERPNKYRDRRLAHGRPPTISTFGRTAPYQFQSEPCPQAAQ